MSDSLSAGGIAHSVPRPAIAPTPTMAPKKPRPNMKKFGMPLYASAWLDERTLVVAGGGGKKSSGIPNRMCVATFDGVTLSEPLFSCHTDETAPQGLIPTPDKTRLLCVFSGDVALYDVAPNPDPPDTLGDTEESDPPPTSGPAVVPCTIVPADPDADGVAHRITLADCDIKCAAFSSDGERLAVGLEDGRVQLCAWRRATEKDLHIEVVATLGQHTDAVTGIAFSPDDSLILTTSAESASKPGQGAAVWSVAEKNRERALSDPSVPADARGASYRFAAFGPAGSNVAYTCLNLGGEGYATRWNTRDWTVISRRRVSKDPVTAAALSPDGGCLVAGDSEGRVVILDAATFATRSVDKDAHMIFVTTVACNDDGSAALSGSADASACARDARGSGAAGSVARVLFAVFACLTLAWLFVFVGSRAAFLSASVAKGAEGGEPEGVNLLDGVDLQYAKEVAMREMARMATARAAKEAAARAAAEAAQSNAVPLWEDDDEFWGEEAAGSREEDEDEGEEVADDDKDDDDEGVESAEDEDEDEDHEAEGDDEDDDEDEERDGDEDAFEDEEDAPTLSREEL